METPKTKILCGSCIRQDLTVLKYHLQSLANLEIPPDVEVEWVFVDDSDDPGTAPLILEALPGAQILSTDPRPDDALYVVGRDTHGWNEETFDHLAKQKQKLLDYVLSNDHTFAYLVDSDIILERRTLISALSCGKSLVSNVFWTQWTRGDSKTIGPNVWLQHPYGQAGMSRTHGEFWKRLVDRRVTQIMGGGAAHLIHRSALEKGVRYFPRLPGLPADGMWQGEDRTFAILAQKLHIHQFADPWPDLFHAYHPFQRTEEVLKQAVDVISAPPQKFAKHGDLINVVLEPLEDPELRDRTYPVRGRLGGLEFVPNLEDLLLDLEIGGDPAFHEIKFPFWWPELGGHQRIIRVHFIDAKPYCYHPILDEFLEAE